MWQLSNLTARKIELDFSSKLISSLLIRLNMLTGENKRSPTETLLAIVQQLNSIKFVDYRFANLIWSTQ